MENGNEITKADQLREAVASINKMDPEEAKETLGAIIHHNFFVYNRLCAMGMMDLTANLATEDSEEIQKITAMLSDGADAMKMLSVYENIVSISVYELVTNVAGSVEDVIERLFDDDGELSENPLDGAEDSN